MIEFKNVTKRYDHDVVALDDINLAKEIEVSGFDAVKEGKCCRWKIIL